MAKKKYKQKPLFWYCIQYDGTNVQEMTAFCPQCIYDSNQQKLFFMGMTVDPTNWILQDNAGIFTMMINEQFVAFFQLDQGPAEQPFYPVSE
jgi:hypothetical protein